MEGVPPEGCDVLKLPTEACLRINFNGCQPSSSSLRLGFQRRPFPPAHINRIQQDGGIVPTVDLVVLRTLPMVFRDWGIAHSVAPEERSMSQECARREALAEEEHRQASIEFKDGSRGEQVHEQGWDSKLADQLRSRVDACLAKCDARPQLTLVALDSQVTRHPSLPWWTRIVALTLPGMPETECPQPMDRVRITCLKAGARSPWGGAVRLYAGRASRLQVCRPVSGSGPPGLPHEALPQSPFCCKGTAALFDEGPPPSMLHNHFCDLLGLLLYVGCIGTPKRTSSGTWRAAAKMFVLAPGRQLCQVLVEEYANLEEDALSRLEHARSHYIRLGADASAVALQNVTFDRHEEKLNMTRFRARRLQLCLVQTQVREDLVYSDEDLQDAMAIGIQ